MEVLGGARPRENARQMFLSYFRFLGQEHKVLSRVPKAVKGFRYFYLEG